MQFIVISLLLINTLGHGGGGLQATSEVNGARPAGGQLYVDFYINYRFLMQFLAVEIFFLHAFIKDCTK